MSQRLANPRLSISEVTYDDMRAAIALWLFGQLFLTFFSHAAAHHHVQFEAISANITQTEEH